MQSIQKRALNEHIFGKNINNRKMLDFEAFRNLILSVWIYAIQLSISFEYCTIEVDITFIEF